MPRAVRAWPAHAPKGPDLIVITAAIAATIAGTVPTAATPAPDAAPFAAVRLVPIAGFDQDTAASPPPPASVPVSAPAQVPAAVPAPATASAAPDSAASAEPATPDVTAPKAPGDIVVSGERKMNKIDPLAGLNQTSFQVIEGVDKALVGPIAHTYRDKVPSPVRMALHNVFFNLTEPVNFVNHLLQLHPGRAFKVAVRFAVNSTVGIGGLLDVAENKPFRIHYRPNGFGNTLGYYGIGPGPYMFLPLVGPTSARDLIGSLLNNAFLPFFVKPFNNRYYVVGAGLITELDYRVDIDDGVERARKTSSPYATYRQLYFKSRFEEIEALHGRGPLAKGEIGQPPFVRPLFPDAAPGDKPSTPALVPAPAPAAPGVGPAAAPVPAAPPPPVFISVPIIQPHAVVEPLPPGYRPGGS